MTVATKAAKPTIKAASIARVLSKAGKTLGFLVKSNSSQEYYQVRIINLAGERIYTCNCHAGQHGYNDGEKKCCHVKAVLEVAQARKELDAEKVAAVAEAQKIVTTAKEEKTTKTNTTERVLNALLKENGQIAGFGVDQLAAGLEVTVEEVEDALTELEKAGHLFTDEGNGYWTFQKKPERRDMAPLNPQSGFSILRTDPAQAVKERVLSAPTPKRQQEDW